MAAQVFLFLPYRAGGYPALVLWLCIVASAIVGLTYLLSVRWSGDWKVSVLGGMLALFMLTVSLAIRPLLLGHLFLLLELQVLQAGIIRQSKWIWLLPPLFVIWTNCHGYLLWARPSQPVFIDGRADIYAWTGVLREYGRWATLKDDPRMLLDRYGIQACLLPATAPMSRVLPLMPHWKLAYSDNLAVVYVREDAEGSRRPSNGEF